MNTQQHFVKAEVSSRMKFCSKRRSKSVKIDIERMKSALDAESFTMPKGLDKEEMRQFIISCATRK